VSSRDSSDSFLSVHFASIRQLIGFGPVLLYKTAQYLMDHRHWIIAFDLSSARFDVVPDDHWRKPVRISGFQNLSYRFSEARRRTVSGELFPEKRSNPCRHLGVSVDERQGINTAGDGGNPVGNIHLLLREPLLLCVNIRHLIQQCLQFCLSRRQQRILFVWHVSMVQQ